MKEVWVKIGNCDKDSILSVVESGADAIWIDGSYVQEAKQLSRIPTISDSGEPDYLIGRDVFIYEIKSPQDQEKIIEISKEAPVLVRTTDWHIIPLENLVASSENIFVEASDLDSAFLALGILEKGVKGVVLEGKDPAQLGTMVRKLKASSVQVPMVPFVVEEVRSIGLGHRVCVDTCSILENGEGMLVGNSSKGLFLIHAETLLGPYAAPRPFRVNAGAVHSYVLCPDQKTRYLMELGSGMEVLVCDYEGKAKAATVGRSKIEKRPLLKITASYQGELYSVILQNAETIRLVAPGGNPISVTGLRNGDEVLGTVLEPGRHFGKKVDGWILEI